VQARHLCGWKGWSQDPPLPRPHLRVGSGGKGISPEILAYLRPSKGKQLFSFVSTSTAPLHWGLSSLTAAWDSTTPLLLLCFPSHHSITGRFSSFSPFCISDNIWMSPVTLKARAAYPFQIEDGGYLGKTCKLVTDSPGGDCGEVGYERPQLLVKL